MSVEGVGCVARREGGRTRQVNGEPACTGVGEVQMQTLKAFAHNNPTLSARLSVCAHRHTHTCTHVRTHIF